MWTNSEPSVPHPTASEGCFRQGARSSFAHAQDVEGPSDQKALVFIVPWAGSWAALHDKAGVGLFALKRIGRRVIPDTVLNIIRATRTWPHMSWGTFSVCVIAIRSVRRRLSMGYFGLESVDRYSLQSRNRYIGGPGDAP